MTTFNRTISGISNQYLFHNVDIVVFVEGGEKNFTKDEVDNNFYSDHSIDVLFWQVLFNNFQQHKKIKFKAVGSKTTVLKIAEDIVGNNLTTVYAAMDREFDGPLGNLIHHKNVLYSFGYSWENDAWNGELIKNIIGQLTAMQVDDDIVDLPYNAFLKEIKLGVYADSYQFIKNSSFFPRDGHLRIIDCDINNMPKVKKEEIDNLFILKSLNKSTIRSHGKRKAIDSKTQCYGHLFGDFCRHIIHHLIKMKFDLGVISKEIIRRLVINNFIDHLPSDIYAYHQNQIS